MDTDISGIGTETWTEKVITETYKSKSDPRMNYSLSFYSDRVRMTRLYKGSNAGWSDCVFEIADDSIYVRLINAPIPRFEGIGTLALRRLEEKSAADGLTWMKIVNSENDYYWGEILRFSRIGQEETLKGARVDFEKRLLEPPIIPKDDFELFCVAESQEEQTEFNAEKFEADAAEALGLGMEDYKMLDPSEITRKLQELNQANERKHRKYILF